MADASATNLSTISATFLKEYPLNIRTDVETCNIKSLVVTKAGNILLSDFGNGKLKLFSPEFKLLSVLKLKEKPWGICLSGTNDDEAYVTLPFKEMILRISLIGELAEVIPISTEGTCRGITWYKDRLAVSVMVGEDAHQIHLMDICGNLKSRIKTKFGAPFHLTASNNSDRILVSDYAKNSVTEINSFGDVLSEYRDKDLSKPYCVATVKDAIFVACYGSGQVHGIQTTNEKVKIVIPWMDICFAPQAIGFNAEDNILYVAGDGDKIRTYSVQWDSVQRQQ